MNRSSLKLALERFGPSVKRSVSLSTNRKQDQQRPSISSSTISFHSSLSAVQQGLQSAFIMLSSSPLELLQPETQTLIMCHISTVASLFSLLRASPRFYQVFRSRREYHLTQLAGQLCSDPASAWHAIRASKLPRPPSLHDAENFTQTFQEDYDYNTPIMPLEMSIPLIRLGACVNWLIADFARDSLNNLTKLAIFMKFEQDTGLVNSNLSDLETRRIGRAFFRAETFRFLFPPSWSDFNDIDKLQPGIRFLEVYTSNEIEEIACIRAYIVRRLSFIFDRIEDDLVEGRHPEPVQKAAQAAIDDPETNNWFGAYGKEDHSAFMDHMMSLGLPFIKDVLSAGPRRCADLVLSNSTPAYGYITDTLENIWSDEPHTRPNPSFWPSSFRDDLAEPNIGWYWMKQYNLSINPSNRDGKGPKDWGYVFWDKERMMGSSILDQYIL